MAKYLVTSALPYANGPIHFGHIAGAYLPADVYVRYLRMAGEDVLYVCGTDEHGVAITLKAEKEGKGYREYVDHWHNEIKSLFDKFQISFDIWSGTARCPQHADTSRKFFSHLLEREFVFDRTEDQWYSEKLDRFLPDRYLEGGCPECGHEKARGDECPGCGAWLDARKLIDPICTIDGSKPVLRATKHWYLDLPKLQEAGLADWYAGKDDARAIKGWKPNVHGHVKAMLKDLRERPITRDLPWGVKLPEGIDDEGTKVLYVWFDAPIGYVSATMEWAEAQGDPESWRDWWQADDSRLVHFIGKDNIAFHMVVFPSMLLGQQDAWGGKNFVLPWAVPANEFYNLQGAKFSTSEGWYLENDDFFSKYSPDAARFHVLYSSPETADAEFTWEGFQTTNNSLLGGKLGNFASRVLKFAGKRFDGQMPPSDGRFNDHKMLKAADTAFAEIGPSLANHKFKAATRSLMDGCDALNQFFDALAPWKLAKSESDDDILACGSVIERCVAYLDLISRRFSPFCPTAAIELRAMLGAAATGDGTAWGVENADTPPATVAEGVVFGEAGVMFPRIDNDAVNAEIEALNERAAVKE